MNLCQLELVVENYDGLTVDEREKLLDTSYKNGNAYLEIAKSNKYDTTIKKETNSRNQCGGRFLEIYHN